MSAQNFSAILLNLDRDLPRLEHMQKQLARAAILFTRQPGILGDTVPDYLRPAFYEADGRPKTIMKRGEIGCYASHLRALQRVAAGEFGAVVLMMEDDLDIPPNLTEILTSAIQILPVGWDILRLSSPPRRAYAPLARIGKDYDLVRYSKIPNSAGAYLVTPAGARKFIERGMRGLTFDDDLRRPWFHHMDTYGIVPAPVHAGVLQSTIDTIEAGRFDKGISSRRERLARGDHRYAFRRVFYNIKNMGAKNWLFCAAINLFDMIAKPVFGRSIIDDAAKFFPLRDRHVS